MCCSVGPYYIAEAERQLGDVTIYKDADVKEKMLQDLAETSKSYSEILRIQEESQKKN